jgi:Tol biopolymer transport system component
MTASGARRRQRLADWLVATLVLCCGGSLMMATPAMGQNHPELNWQVIETDHFRVFFHDGLAGAADRTAEIAEAAYGPVTQLYRYEPDGKVRIILKDYNDTANGAAYFYLDTIEIWTTSLDHDFDLRGTSDWLSNVVTHEFVHIISLGAARKAPQRFPALYLQYFGYQRERDRAHILTGYPNVIASYPLATTVIPMWFAEGVAQFQVAGARHDSWDTHRDMILRTAVLDDALLSFDEMGTFGKRGFGNEFVYDHGFGLVRHIAQEYGDEAIADICAEVSKWRTLEIDAAIEAVLGVSAQELHTAWRDTMSRRYNAQIAALGDLQEGEEVTDRGFSNIHPSYSPDGLRLAYLSTLDRQYGPHALVVRDLASGEEEVLTAGVVSSISWSPDGERLLFVRKGKADKYGSRQADLYVYDLEGRDVGLRTRLLWALPSAVTGHGPKSPRISRLSHGLRALYPAFSPDGEWIAFVHNRGTNNNLGIMKADGTQIRYLTDLTDGTQLYTPRWSPDGQSLVLSISRRGQRDIAILRSHEAASMVGSNLAAGGAGSAGLLAALQGSDVGQSWNQVSAFHPLVTTAGTDRDPVWTTDGSEVVFSSDASGIFNIYAIDVNTGATRQLTNLIGGGIAPTVSVDGSVAFSSYGPNGYRIRQLADTEGEEGEGRARPAAGAGSRANGNLGGAVVATSGSGQEAGDRLSLLTATRSGTDGHAMAATAPAIGRTAKPYGSDFLKTLLLPRLIWDEGHFKGGVYAATSDALNRQSIFGGLAVAPSNGDRDLFALYEYHGWRPTAFLEFYHQKRHTGRGDSTAARDAIITGRDFSLSQISTGLRGTIGRNTQLQLSLTYDRYDASLKWDFFEPRRDGVVGFVRRRQKPVGYTYLNGFDLGLTYQYQAATRRRDRAINPRGGRKIYFRYDRNFNFFLEQFKENTSFLEEEFLHLFYNQFTLDWNEYVGLPHNTSVGLRFFGGWIASDEVDDKELVNDFFDYHLGGLNFMKGYTFYSIAGRKAMMGTATFRFPVAPEIGARFQQLYLDKIYAAVYADIGKAWDGDIDDADPIYGRSGPLRDLGGQLRLDLISYYSMPTRVQADVAYGIDQVDGRSPWKFYFTLLFGYL